MFQAKKPPVYICTKDHPSEQGMFHHEVKCIYNWVVIGADRLHHNVFISRTQEQLDEVYNVGKYDAFTTAQSLKQNILHHGGMEMYYISK